MAKRKPKTGSRKTDSDGGNIGTHKRLWRTAARVLGHAHANVYQYSAPGLIFLNHIVDAFEETHRVFAPCRDAAAFTRPPIMEVA